ncbi:hypothetical protein INT45_009658 [Circinella minor]|uniref:Uncharacterized protein n=1 Tax=Circinella minor TaxID=1195481 RepID=A0A8H7RUV3_9FUNG|nr:hypothetical protein INT45_009658 [Circinella minor]
MRSCNMADDLLEFEEDVSMEDDVYSTRELSNALPYADFVENSPSRTRRNYAQEDVIAVLKAHFYDGLCADEAGARVGMPKTTAAKLIRTYRPQMPAPPPRPRSQARTPRQSFISRVDTDVLAAALQR